MIKFDIKSVGIGFILGAVCLTTAFSLSNGKGTETASGAVSCPAQNELLKEAMDYVGVTAPEKAVWVWAEGLRQRSAAMQYSVMTEELKNIYEKALEKHFPNWVTGISSPWVESYQITGREKADDETEIFHVKFNTASSAGEEEPFTATVKVAKVGDFWRILEVSGDEALAVYTGF